MKTKVPSSIGLAIVLIAGFFAFAAESNPSSFSSALHPPQVGEVFTEPSVTVVTPQAMHEIAAVQMAVQTPETPITPELLPKVQLVPPPTASASKKSKKSSLAAGQSQDSGHGHRARIRRRNRDGPIILECHRGFLQTNK